MERFAVIGLGRFGSRLAKNLAASGAEVIAVDADRRIVEELRDQVTLAIALDATHVAWRCRLARFGPRKPSPLPKRVSKVVATSHPG